MASWGLAAYTGRKMWEDATKVAEENERYKAGRALFDLQLQEDKETAKLQAQANKESRRIASNLNTYKSRIQRGDKKALAEFMSSIDTNSDTSWSVVGDSIVEQDESGNIVTNIPLKDVSGAAMLSMAQQFVPTADKVAEEYRIGVASNQKYMQELQKAMMDVQARLEVAKINGASSATVAQLNGEYSLLREQLKAASDANLKNMDSSAGISMALAKEGLSQWQDAASVRQAATVNALATMSPNAVPQFDSNGNLTMLTDMSTGEQVTPDKLSTDFTSELNNRARQFITTGLQQAAATNFSGPMVGYLTNATNQYVNNLNQNIADIASQIGNATTSVQGLPVLAVPTPQAQLGVGTPSVDTSSLQAPVVYSYISPTDVGTSALGNIVSNFEAATEEQINSANRARLNQALQSGGAWWLGDVSAGIPAGMFYK